MRVGLLKRSVLVFLGLLVSVSASARMKSSVALKCEGEQEGYRYSISISSSSEAEISFSHQRQDYSCPLMLAEFNDLRHGQSPFVGFGLSRVKACSPLLSDEILKAFKADFYLSLKEIAPSSETEFTFLYRRNSSSCRLTKFKEADLRILMKRLRTKPLRMAPIEREEPEPPRTKSKLEHWIQKSPGPGRSVQSVQ